jgi:DNA-binding GntR family transcriptional regulator
MKSSSNLITGGVIAKIRSMILAAELKPGHRLVEEQFTQLLGVGRTPVREALLLLQGEGFVARNHRGWEVRGLNDPSIQTVFECRCAIEAESARLAARKMQPRTLEKLAALVERMEPGAYADRMELHRVNDEFHLLILHAAENELLCQCHERALIHYLALGTPVLFNDQQAAAANRQHRDLLDALGRGAEDEAEQLARTHVLASQEIVETFIRIVAHFETISNISSLEAQKEDRWRPLGR